jgi:hypothetical protein
MSLLFERDSLLLGSDLAGLLPSKSLFVLPSAIKRPSFTRESITWRTVGNEVEVSVALVNNSDEPTASDTLNIEAAAFGAFIPNHPVARIAVGSLEPGEEWTATARLPVADLPAPAVRLPSFHMRRLFKNLTQHLNFGKVNGWVDSTRALDWIGNFNVYFDTDPEDAIERHVAFGLKVAKGSVIMALFCVDAEQFDAKAVSSSDNWEPELALSRSSAYLFVKTPDKAGETSNIRAEVTRLPDKATVFVEFEFETVEGWGESVGCVAV